MQLMILNQNGRLELILAINNGTALYTDFAIFEVNEEFNGLQKYQFADSNTYMKDVVTGEVISDSLPDIIVDKVEWTKSSQTRQVEYYWRDSLKMNYKEHYIGHYKVWLEDGLVYQTLAAYKYSQSDEEEIKTTYYDESGNEISEEQFNELILSGVEKTEKELNWKKYQDVIDTSQENEAEQQRGTFDIDKYNISDAELKKSIQECVKLKEGTVIDSITWVDEEEKCMRVSIRYVQQPENLWYNHVEDYFFFVKEDEIEVLYVDYSNGGKFIREVWENPDFSAHFEDVNFDGQADLIVSLGVNGTAYGEQYCAYLYTEEGYEYCPSFEELSRYYVDYQNKQIVSTTYESTDNGRVEVINYYIFKNNMFQKL